MAAGNVGRRTLEYRRVNLSGLHGPAQARLLRQIHRQILAPTFPPNELTPLDVLLAQATGTPPRLAVHAILRPDGRPLACALGQWYPRSHTLLLAYLAVVPSLRSRGIGSKLLADAMHDCVAVYRPELLVGEVEDPAVYPSTTTQDPAARLRLYGRLGARRVDLGYVQPEVNPGAGRARDLFLLVAPEHSAGVLRLPDGEYGVPATAVRDFLAEYYADVEGDDFRDAEYDRMLASLGDAEIARLLTISQ